jgi:hypothetical protein
MGIALSLLAVAANGYLLYKLSGSFPNEASLGRVGHYILSPVAALLVGACVGAIAKTRPGLLAVLSLLPSALAFFFVAWRRVEGHFLRFLLFEIVYLIIAVAAASVVFSARERTRRSRQEYN